MNINVVGTSGSGKSTLARRLAHRLELPWIELDRLYWRPNWQGAPDEAFFAAIAAATATPGWVLDGNYNRSRSVKWRAVDLVIWVDYGFWRTLRQAVWRAARPGVATSGSCGRARATARVFAVRSAAGESIILWTLKTWRQHRRRYLADMQDPQYRHIRFVRVRNPRQAEALLRELEAQRSAGHI